MKKFLVAGIATVVFGAPVVAADMEAPVYKAPVYKAVEPGYNWTGWYGGVNAGIGVAQTNVSLAPIGASFIDVAERSGNGFAGGVQAGFNWQFAPNWVIGIEGDIGYLGIDRSFQDWNITASYGVKTDWYGTVRGRFGYSSGPSLFYATGGAAFVNVRNNFDSSAPPATTATSSKVASGWTAGGGIETMLGGNWSAKAEYLYIDAGGQDVFNPDFNDNAGLTARFDNRFHVYRYGLNYKFGGPPSVIGALPARNWTGFYAGVNAGLGLAQSHANTNSIAGAVDIAGAAFSGGVQAGYNWQLTPNWVTGIEGDLAWLNADRSVLDTSREVLFGIRTDWYGTLRGRLGYSTGPALLYITGGAAFVNVRNAFDNVDAMPAIRASESKTATGWTAGGGIEAALSQNWSAKTEYLYIDAGRQDVFNPTLGGGVTTRYDNRFHVFRYGMNYTFGG